VSTTTLLASPGPDDPGPVGPSALADIVAAALTAFSHDVSYAVSMARAASSIRDKRDTTTEPKRTRTSSPR
jgi:hypothetical protein